jgi:cytochrome c biogenesis protein CcmG/thiol:disulfide interchange protein DsbE
MKRWSLPFGALLVALGAAFYYQQLQAGNRTGFPAPDFTLQDLSGQVYRLADFQGKVVFLNVWATWCAPCRMEMPSMERLYRRFQGSDFVMLAVSEDEDGAAAVRPFVDDLGLTFPILIDRDGTIPQRYGVTGYPETFVIDRQGRVAQHLIGPENWASEQVFDFFSRLLAQDQPLKANAEGAGVPTGG